MKTDRQLIDDVRAELNWDVAVDATDVTVTAERGVVSLGGSVGSYAQKWDIEQAAQRVVGVTALTIELSVQPANSHVRTDQDLARNVRQALEWASYLSKDTITVMVEDGWVTLSGTVEWDYQRQSANSAIRYLNGLRGINNNITLTPRKSSGQIRADIEASLTRRFDGEHVKIAVSVVGHDVTLDGSVAGWWQKQRASESAWNATGVEHVTNNLHIS